MKNKLALDYINFLEKEIVNVYKRMYSKGISEKEHVQLRLHLDSLQMELQSLYGSVKL